MREADESYQARMLTETRDANRRETIASCGRFGCAQAALDILQRLALEAPPQGQDHLLSARSIMFSVFTGGR